MINIRKLEADLWESADLLRAGSKLTSNQYCMPVLGLIFLRYAYSRFKLVEKEILKNRPVRNGRVMPVEASDFASKSALFLPREAQYEYLVNLPADIASAGLTNQSGHTMNSLGEVVNNAMELVEAQSEQLKGVLPKDYTMFSDALLAELLRIFNNNALDEVGGDMLFSENLSKQDIQKIKKVAVDLLEKVKAKIAELDHWTDKQETKATIDNLIRDTLWAELPESYDEVSISVYRQKIYEYVYTRYKNVA